MVRWFMKKLKKILKDISTGTNKKTSAQKKKKAQKKTAKPKTDPQVTEWEWRYAQGEGGGGYHKTADGTRNLPNNKPRTEILSEQLESGSSAAQIALLRARLRDGD